MFGEDWDRMKPNESEVKTHDTLCLERIGTEWSRMNQNLEHTTLYVWRGLGQDEAEWEFETHDT